MILRATAGNASLRFSAIWTLVWHVSINSDAPPVFLILLFVPKNHNSTAIYDARVAFIMLVRISPYKIRSEMVMQP